MNLRKVTNIELILSRTRMVIGSQIPSVLNRWKNFFNHVLNGHGVHVAMQTYTYR
jgi:hypothetical protein